MSEIQSVGDHVLVKYADSDENGLYREKPPFRLVVQAPFPHFVGHTDRSLLPGDEILSISKPVPAGGALHVVKFADVVARVAEEVQGADRLFYGKTKRLVLPISACYLEGSGLSIEVQQLFQADQLVIDPSTAKDWKVTGIMVGVTLQMVSLISGGIPATVFAPNPQEADEEPLSNAPRLLLDPCAPGMAITLMLKSNSESWGAKFFGGGCFVGRVAQ